MMNVYLRENVYSSLFPMMNVTVYIYTLCTELENVFAVFSPFIVAACQKSALLHVRCKCCTFDSIHVCDVTKKPHLATTQLCAPEKGNLQGPTGLYPYLLTKVKSKTKQTFI